MKTYLASILLGSLLVLVASLGGCDGSALPPSSTSSYLGAWQSSAGTSTITCANGTSSAEPVTYRITFGAGAAGELLEATGSCVTPFDVAGAGLEALPGHTCWERTRPDVSLFVDAETFTSSDGQHGADVARGRVEGLVDAGGAPLACSWRGEAFYDRIGP